MLLGGAALTRAYVEQDLAEIYAGDVRYARDAFEGLRLMDALMAVRRGGVATTPDGRRTPTVRRGVAQARRRKARRSAPQDRRERAGRGRACRAAGPLRRRDRQPDSDAAVLGRPRRQGHPARRLRGLLDERATFLGQWGLRGARGGEGPSYEELVETEGRPRLRYWLDRFQTEQLLEAAVVYGYYPLCQQGRRPHRAQTRAGRCRATRFTFPRQRRERRLCLADFFRAEESGQTDVVGVHGRRPSATRSASSPHELFEANAYRDYLEAARPVGAADRGAGRVLAPPGAPGAGPARRDRVAADDPADLEDYFKLGYRGARYSLGYGACPNLEDRAKIVQLLRPDRIGVELSEEFQLHPEQSTDAIVVHHPEAKYFNT